MPKNRIEYSKIVRDKMRNLKADLTIEYGKDKAKTILAKMVNDIDVLEEYEKSGTNISEMYNIDTEYWYVFTQHNYFVYRIEVGKVIIVQMFHEREDFMMKLFGMSGRTEESIDFWGE